MGTAASAIGLGLTAVGTGVSVVGSIRQGRAAQDAARYNAAAQEQNAAIALQESQRQSQLLRYQAGFQERDAAAAAIHAKNLESQASAARLTGEENTRRKRETNRRILSRMRSRIAGSGVTSAGSPVEILADASGNLELEALQIGVETENRTRALYSAAENSRSAGMRIGADAALTRYSADASGVSGRYRAAMLSSDADFSRAQASYAGTSTMLNAGSSLLSGAGTYLERKSKLRHYGAL